MDIIEIMASRVSSPIFAGRGAELETVRAALAAAGEGRSHALLIAGEAGVGKSRLVAEAAETARAGGFRVLAGGCIELAEGSFPFAPFVEALRTLSTDLEPSELERLMGDGRSELARLMPAIGRSEDDASRIGRLTQGRLFELCAGLLSRLSADRPVLLVIEDLHWADRSTLDLLTYLIRALRAAPIALLATYRSDELHRGHPLLRILAELERSGRMERLELRGLDPEDVAVQMKGIRGFEPDAALVGRIHARTQGNPFYTEELLAARALTGELPDSLRDVLLAHLSTLSDETQELLRVASAGGMRVSGTVLAAVTGRRESDLAPALREAIARHVVVPATNPPDGYAFRHALVQEALYSELLPGERTALHVAYARVLGEGSGGGAGSGGVAAAAGSGAVAADSGVALPDPALAAEIAYHWRAAHDVPRAFGSSVVAGFAAERAYAFAEAQKQYERALEYWDRVPDAATRIPLDRVALLERAARTAEAAGSPTRAIAHIRTALGLVDVASDSVRAGLLYERLARYSSEIAAADTSIAAAQEAVRLVPAEPPTEARARVLAELGRCLSIFGRPQEGAPCCEQAIRAARAVGSGAAEIEANALISLANCLATFGDPDGAIESAERARELALEIGAPEVVIRAYYALGFIYAIGARRYEESAAVNLEGFEYAERNGLIRTAAASGLDLLAGAAYDLHALGRWDEAEQVLERARQAGADESEARPYLFHGVRIGLDVGRGRLALAEERLEAAERLNERGGEAAWVAMTSQLRAELAIWNGNPAAARAAAAQGVDRLTASDSGDVDDLGSLFSWGIRAEAESVAVARIRHSYDEVERSVRTGAAYLERMRVLAESATRRGPAAAAVASADLAVCEAEMARLRGAGDATLWRAAADRWAGLRMPYRRAYALYREAEAVLGSGGGRKRAEEPLRVAHEIALRLGAEPLCGEIEGLAERGRVDLLEQEPEDAPIERPVAPDSFGLTAREREVLSLVAAGRTNREIGEALFISGKTAGVHVSNILGKLGVSGRVEAATLAQRLGLIDRSNG